MEKLLSLLFALKFASADVHYYVKGDNFWGDHKFADDIREDIDEWVDGINEVCFLGTDKETPYSKDIIRDSINYIPARVSDSKQMFINLRKLIFDILAHIESILPDCSAGEANLLGGIAQDLQQRYGLIGRRIK